MVPRTSGYTNKHYPIVKPGASAGKAGAFLLTITGHLEYDKGII